MAEGFQRVSRKRGAAALEYTLIFPVIMGIIGGSLEYTWYLTLNLLLTLSVTQGVYEASLSTLAVTDADIITAAKTQINAQWAVFNMGSTILYTTTGNVTVSPASIQLACYPSTGPFIGVIVDELPCGTNAIEVGSLLTVNAAIAYQPLFAGLVPSPPSLRASTSMLLEP